VVEGCFTTITHSLLNLCFTWNILLTTVKIIHNNTRIDTPKCDLSIGEYRVNTGFLVFKGMFLLSCRDDRKNCD
jgi:hypothetical protein